MYDIKECITRIKLLKKLKRNMRVGTQERRDVNAQIRTLKEELNETFDMSGEKENVIRALQGRKKYHTDLRKFSIEELLQHYFKEVGEHYSNERD